jgi:hypothetical protein
MRPLQTLLKSSGAEVFRQAAHAEAYGLTEVAGVGYRKALEYLVKDYCISKKPAQAEKIKGKFLANVIAQDLDNSNVQACALRATWLGNDEAHYVRRWEERDIQDLKLLIELTVGWIRQEVLTARYLEEMQPPIKEEKK